MTVPAREVAFAALAPKTPEEHAEHDVERVVVGQQHAAGLRLAQIVAVAPLVRVAAIVHAPNLAATEALDPEAAEVIRSTCYRRLIELSQ